MFQLTLEAKPWDTNAPSDPKYKFIWSVICGVSSFLLKFGLRLADLDKNAEWLLFY